MQAHPSILYVSFAFREHAFNIDLQINHPNS